MTFPPWGRYFMGRETFIMIMHLTSTTLKSQSKKIVGKFMLRAFFSSSFEETSSDLLPDCHEGKSKEKAQGAAKLSNQGGERVKQNFLLDLGCMGCRPEAYEWRIDQDFWAALHKLVLLVMARFRASSLLYDLICICIAQSLPNLFKLFELLLIFADSSILLTPLVPRKPAANFLRKFFLGAACETVTWIFLARSSLKVEFFVPRQGNVVVISGFI